MVLHRDNRSGLPWIPTSAPAAATVPRRPLQVCMVATYDLASPGGGVKHHAQQLAAALRRRGDDVTLIGPSSAPIEHPDTETFPGVINVPANGSDNYLGLFVSPRRIARFFREHRFDVIHIHEPLQPALSYWTVWLTRETPHVATFHAYAEAESRLLRWARSLWGRTIFPWFQRGIAVSAAASQYAGRAWNRPLAIIPNGIATDLFTPGRGLHRGLGAALRLLFVGRVGDRRKGARYLFEAYRGLLARGLAVELDVVGELGAAEPPPPLPGLRYHGAVGLNQLTQLYRDCDVFVAPSTGQESFGIVLLEAMASAKPVVCSDIDGYREVAVTDGAYLVPPADARALEERLAHVVQLDPLTRRRQGEHNRIAAERYDWDRIATHVRDEYVAAIAARRLTKTPVEVAG